MNGDGIDDIIIGSYDLERAYVVFGSENGFGTDVDGRQVLDLASLSSAEGFVLAGDDVGDWFGNSVSSAGDINGDGIDDLLIGARDGDDGGTDSGEAYVVFGTSSGFGSTDEAGRQVLDVTNLSAVEGFVI